MPRKKAQQTPGINSEREAVGQSIELVFFFLLPLWFCFVYSHGICFGIWEGKKEVHFFAQFQDPGLLSTHELHEPTRARIHREHKCWRISDALVFNTPWIPWLPAIEWLIPAGGFFVFLRQIQCFQPSPHVGATAVKPYPFFECIISRESLWSMTLPFFKRFDLSFISGGEKILIWGYHVSFLVGFLFSRCSFNASKKHPAFQLMRLRSLSTEHDRIVLGRKREIESRG